MTSMVTPDGELEGGTAYAVRVKAYNGIAWSQVTCVVVVSRMFVFPTRIGNYGKIFFWPQARAWYHRRGHIFGDLVGKPCQPKNNMSFSMFSI